MSSFDSKRGPPEIEGMTSLKVDNLTYRTTVGDLEHVFSKYGELGDVYIPREPLQTGIAWFCLRSLLRETGRRRCNGCPAWKGHRWDERYVFRWRSMEDLQIRINHATIAIVVLTPAAQGIDRARDHQEEGEEHYSNEFLRLLGYEPLLYF